MIHAGAQVAWQSLESKLRPFIARRVGSRADVDDVVQDVFLRMQQGLPGLRNSERFGPWVYQVARSAAAEHRRRVARSPVAACDAPDELAADSEEEDDGAIERDLAACIAPFVAMLPSPYREALTLVELEGLTQKEAAAMVGVSLSGMKSRVQRGRLRLREALEACCKIALDARGRVVAFEPRSDGRRPACRCR